MTTATMPGPGVTVTPAVPDNDAFYEIIDGERVELPPMSIYSSWIANWLLSFLNEFARARSLRVAVGEMLFRFPPPVGRSRRPDVAWVSYERWSKDRPMPLEGNAWEVVPDLAVEVISPSDLAEEVLDKLLEYFRAGVRLVWVVYPVQRVIYAYQSPTQVRILTGADELDGGSVLPAFRLALSVLFEDQKPSS